MAAPPDAAADHGDRGDPAVAAAAGGGAGDEIGVATGCVTPSAMSDGVVAGEGVAASPSVGSDGVVGGIAGGGDTGGSAGR